MNTYQSSVDVPASLAVRALLFAIFSSTVVRGFSICERALYLLLFLKGPQLLPEGRVFLVDRVVILTHREQFTLEFDALCLLGEVERGPEVVEEAHGGILRRLKGASQSPGRTFPGPACPPRLLRPPAIAIETRQESRISALAEPVHVTALAAHDAIATQSGLVDKHVSAPGAHDSAIVPPGDVVQCGRR